VAGEDAQQRFEIVAKESEFHFGDILRRQRSRAMPVEKSPLLDRARVALERFELDSAQKLYEQLAASKNLPELQIRARIGLARVTWWRRKETQAKQQVEIALAQARLLKHPHALADALLGQGWIFSQEDMYRAAAASLGEGAVLLAKHPSPPLEARLYSALGLVQTKLAERVAADKSLSRALQIAQASGDGVAEVDALGARSNFFAEFDDLPQALTLVQQAVSRSLALANSFQELNQRVSQARICVTMGDLAGAQAALDKVKPLAARVGDPYNAAQVFSLQGSVCAGNKKYTQAREFYTEGRQKARTFESKRIDYHFILETGRSFYEENRYEEAHKIIVQGRNQAKAEGHAVIELAFLVLLCQIAGAEAKLDEAMAHAHAVVVMVQKQDQPLLKVKALLLRMQTRLQKRQYKGATADGQAALSEAQSAGARQMELLARLLLGTSLYAEEKKEEAIEGLEKGILVGRSLVPVDNLAEAYALLGKMYYDQEKNSLARIQFSEALSLFSQLKKDDESAGVEAYVGYTHMAEQDFSQAHAPLGRSIALYRKLQKFKELAETQVYLAQCLAAETNFAQAASELDSAVAQYRQLGDKAGELNAFFSMGNIAVRKAKYDRAQVWLEAALPVTQSLKDRVKEARVLYLLGAAYTSLDLPKTERAQRMFEQAQVLYQDLKDKQEEGRCWHSLGQLFAYREDEERAKECHEKAKELGFDPDK
jgi:tetratricopeptide (TPR) repeat protein